MGGRIFSTTKKSIISNSSFFHNIFTYEGVGVPGEPPNGFIERVTYETMDPEGRIFIPRDPDTFEICLRLMNGNMQLILAD